MTDAASHLFSQERVPICLFASRFTVDRHGLSALAMTKYFTPGLRVPGMALLGYRPFGPSPSRSAFPFRNVRHPSVHSSLATAFGNRHGSLWRGCGYRGRS